MKKIFLLLLLPSFILAWDYYYQGERRQLNKLSSLKRGINYLIFRTSNNVRVGVGRYIVFRPKNDVCLQIILNKFPYSYKRIGSDVVLSVNDPYQTIEIANDIYESGCATYSHPDFLVFPKKRTDPLFKPQQWNFYNYGQFYSKSDIDLNVYEAWLYSKGEGVKVALIDDGFDIDHVDLKSAFRGGYSIVYQTTDIRPDNAYEFHGTLCAGLIGARENGVGLVGVAPRAELYGIKLLISDGNGEPLPLYTSDIVKAFLTAKDVDVINCSWGTYNVADNVRWIIDELATKGRNGKGIPIVFASGNDGMPQYYWKNDESALDSVIAVGAVTNLGEHPWYSNYGPYLDFVAPSGGGTLAIATTDLRGGVGLAKGYYGHPDYTYATDPTGFNGTSAAAPQVSGVIALMIARDPDLTKDEIVEILRKTAKKVGDIPYYNGRNDYFGYGLVDAKAALEEVIRRKGLRDVAGKGFDVQGYFFHYGPGAYDWIYVNASLSFVAKLEGMDHNGYLQWRRLLFEKVSLNEGKIIFSGAIPSDSLAKQLENKRFTIDGYFIHYAQGAYDWIYIVAGSGRAYKLEGLDYSGNFLWIDLFKKARFDQNRVEFPY